jgi:hypothetical protein
MSKPWYDTAASKLDPGDSFQKTYSCSYNKNNGYLCLGNQRLVFVNVKGFLKKSYDVMLDIPYSDLDEVALAGRFKMNLKDDDTRHTIETSDISAKLVMNGMQEVIANSPELEVKFVEN